MDNFPKLHTYAKFCRIGQSKKSRNILYIRTLVQDPNMEHIGKIIKRVVGRMIQLWIYKTLEMMRIG
jgi:hypothetical protein